MISWFSSVTSLSASGNVFIVEINFIDKKVIKD